MDTEFREIDLAGWKLAGGGNQGESYSDRNDPTRMLKLFNEFYPKEKVLEEYRLAREVQRSGIPSPGVLEAVRCGNRYGIIFECIANKKSLARLCGEQPDRIPEFARRLCEAGRYLHGLSTENVSFPRTIDFYRALFTPARVLSEDERAKMELAFSILEKEDGKSIVHGDFHFGNLITNGVRDYFIDLGTVSKGNPKWDFSMLYLMCKFMPEEMEQDMFHMTKADAENFWTAFKEENYGTDAPSDGEFLRSFAPYIYVRTLFFPDELYLEPSRAFRKAVENCF